MLRTVKPWLLLPVTLLALLCLGGCCLSDIFEDDDDVDPSPHNEGAAGDV